MTRKNDIENKRLLLKGLEVMKFVYTYCYELGLLLDESYSEMQADDLRKLAGYIEERGFLFMMYRFDFSFLVCLYYYFISIQDYDNVDEITRQVQDHNDFFGDNLTL